LTRDPFPGVMGMPATLHPYVYALNNPVLYTDPSGEFAFIPLIIAAVAGGVLGGVGYYGLEQHFSEDACAEWNWYEAAFWGGAGAVHGAAIVSVTYGGYLAVIKLLTWTATVTTYLGADGDPSNEAAALSHAIQNGLYAIRNGLGQGYQSFRVFKIAQGQAGPGMAWHHIVTQTPVNIQRFGAQVIHNTNNLIQLPHGSGSLHQQITNYLNSIIPRVTGSQTLKVYEWLQMHTLEYQWRFGIDLIQKLGGAQNIINHFGDKFP